MMILDGLCCFEKPLFSIFEDLKEVGKSIGGILGIHDNAFSFQPQSLALSQFLDFHFLSCFL